MPSEEDRRRGTRPAPSVDDESGQPNKGISERGKMSSTEGDVRVILRDTTNVANAANDEQSLTKLSKRKVRLNHAIVKKGTRQFSTESVEAGKDASESNGVAETDEVNLPLPDGVGEDESDPAKWLQTRRERSCSQSPSWKEHCTVSRRRARRIKVQEMIAASPHESTDAVACKSSANDAAGSDFASIYASSTYADNGSQRVGKTKADHVRQATAKSRIAEIQCYNMAPPAFDPSKHTVGISSYDVSSQGNILAVSDYVADIFQRLYHCESHMPRATPQKSTAPRKRAVLMEWMVYVQRRCHLLPEALHLAFDIVDRYLSKKRVRAARLQLLAATALFIASKYEQICPVRLSDLAHFSGGTYKRQDVIDMEAKILRAIDFRVSKPTTYSFLGRFLFLADAPEMTRFAATYYLELAVQDCDLLSHRPSLVALAVVCLAINHPKVREKDGLDSTLPGVPAILTTYSGYEPENVSSVARQIAQTFASRTPTCFKAVTNKYQTLRYAGVANLGLPETFPAETST